MLIYLQHDDMVVPLLHSALLMLLPVITNISYHTITFRKAHKDDDSHFEVT